MKRWLRVFAVYTPALLLAVAGVTVLLATLTSNCVYHSCPITNGTSTCSCMTEYSENPAGWFLVSAGVVYAVVASAAWWVRVVWR